MLIPEAADLAGAALLENQKVPPRSGVVSEGLDVAPEPTGHPCLRREG